MDGDVQMSEVSSSGKRGAPKPGGPRAKKSAGGGGNAGGSNSGTTSGEADPQPIQRPFKSNRAHLQLNVSTFEEITSDKLKYFTGCMSPCKLFNSEQRIQAGKFAAIYPFVSVSNIKVRLSRFVFLLDEIGAIGGTPITTTSITPHMYFCHLHPADATTISYQLRDGNSILNFDIKNKLNEPGGAAGSALTDVVGMSDLEDLQMFAWSENFWGGISTASSVAGLKVNGAHDFKVAQNLSTNYKNRITSRIVDRANLSYVNAGDVVEFTVNTNLKGKNLNAKDVQSWFDYVDATSDDPDAFYTWPGDFTAFVNRGTLQNADIATLNMNDGPLNHHFFICPPIKKGDNTILKQRVSCVMEYSMHLNFWSREDIAVDDLLAQNNAQKFNVQNWWPSNTVSTNAETTQGIIGTFFT